jgi:hypothetical protein
MRATYLLKKFSAFYKTQNFIAVIATAHPMDQILSKINPVYILTQ